MNITSKKLKLTIPFIILFILFALLWHELFYFKRNELPSALIGEEMPAFQIPDLTNPNKMISQKDFTGKVGLLNVWASWCYGCAIEQPMLLKIRDDYHVPIYGIVYKDNPESALDWLNTYGNPFTLVGEDRSGDLGIDLGVYGTPETFLISAEGRILYRHVGALDQRAWDEVLYPLVKKYQGVG